MKFGSYFTDTFKNEKVLRETQTLHTAYAGRVRPPSLYQI